MDEGIRPICPIRHIRPDELSEGEVVVDLVLGRRRGLFRFRTQDLIEQPRAAMAGVADAARDACEPRLEGGAQGVWEDDGGLESSAQFSRDGEDAVARLDGQHGIDFGNGLPEIRELGGREDRDVGVGPAALDGAHGGDAHDGVAEPVRGADDDAEGGEGL